MVIVSDPGDEVKPIEVEDKWEPSFMRLSPSKINTYMKCPREFYYKYIAKIPEKKTIVEVPDVDEELVKQLGLLEKQIEDYSNICKKIDKNNLYIQERESLTFDLSMKAPEESQELYDAVEEFKNDINKLSIHKRNVEKSLIEIDTSDTCYACAVSYTHLRAHETS